MRYYWELTPAELYKVRQIVLHALDTGELQRKEICEHPHCNVATIGIVAHHEDYDQPLEITWLCRRHHRERHAEINKLRPKDYILNPPIKSPTPHIRSTMKLWPDNYQDKPKPEKFMAHFPDICYCGICSMKRKEKAWRNRS